MTTRDMSSRLTRIVDTYVNVVPFSGDVDSTTTYGAFVARN